MPPDELERGARAAGAWARPRALVAWSRRHFALLSVLYHGGLLVAAWFVAFCLVYNFAQSRVIFRRATVDVRREPEVRGGIAECVTYFGGLQGLRLGWGGSTVDPEGRLHVELSPCAGAVWVADTLGADAVRAAEQALRSAGCGVLPRVLRYERASFVWLLATDNGAGCDHHALRDALGELIRSRQASAFVDFPRETGCYVVGLYRDEQGAQPLACSDLFQSDGARQPLPAKVSDVPWPRPATLPDVDVHPCPSQPPLTGTLRIRAPLPATAVRGTAQFQFYDWFTRFWLPLVVPVVLIKLAVFVWMGVHRASWRYVSLRDVFTVARAAWWGFLFVFALFYGWLNVAPRLFGPASIGDWGYGRFPDSVFVLDFAGTIALVCATRLAARLYSEEKRPRAEGAVRKLLIVGAGNAAENVVREILRTPVERYEVVGFLDDDRAKWKTEIHGFPVLGSIDSIRELCALRHVDEILIAMPSASRERLRKVIELCQGTNLRFKTLPALSDLIAGRASVKEIRDVDINDLLGRAPVRLDDDEIAKFIRGRVVAVTGAGGSIGSELCRQIAQFAPAGLILIERAEPNLFPIDQELRRDFPRIRMVPCIADIADRVRMDRIFRQERPTAVFHAAAHKHVPMMEYNPGEALKNNVQGTRVVADAALEAGVEKFVMISTDKAVNPTSIMGCSKRVAEMYIQGLTGRGPTQFVTVRFGNVLGSSGSVIPIFREQIARGGPVTVTHPDMIRYFMTIPEASQLVLQAASMGKGGEIFVLDMGEPCKIVDLAREMITLSGFRPDVDIRITFTGMRPGEKLYEELAIDGEGVARTAHPKIGIWRNLPVDWECVVAAIDRLVHDADVLDREQARHRLKEIVPEFYLETPPPRAADDAGGNGRVPETGAKGAAAAPA